MFIYVLDSDASSVTISGRVAFPVSFQGPIQSGSCLRVHMRLDDDCKANRDCKGPVAASQVIRFNGGENTDNVAFSIDVQSSVTRGMYVFTFTFNNGWCGEGSQEGLRVGDFYSFPVIRYNVGFISHRMTAYLLRHGETVVESKSDDSLRNFFEIIE